MAFVRRSERVGNLPRDVQGFVKGQRTARDPLREVLTLDELHHERALMSARTGGQDFDTVDLCDLGMVQRGERPRFTVEPREPFRIRGHRCRKNLQRHIATELRVGGAVHQAHSAFAEFGEDFVGPDSTPRGQHGPLMPMVRSAWGHADAPKASSLFAHFASGSGRSWKCTALLVWPLPPS